MPNYKRLFKENHYYFITINTYKRQPILIENIQLLRYAFAQSKQFYEYKLFAISVLPDHLHMLIRPKYPTDYPKIISYVKRKFTYMLNQSNSSITTINSQSRIKNRESNIWQRRYYEHTIRNEIDLNFHLDYIHFNPVKHGYVQNQEEWEFSSFSKFVKLGWYEEDSLNPPHQ